MSRNEKGQFAAGAPSERRRKWVGERLGKLVVLSVEYGVQTGKKQRTVLTCRCDCGNIVTKIADSIKDREHASCGCDSNERRIQKNRKDLTGQRFGRLVVKEMLWTQPHTKCRCICDCGNEAIVASAQLTYGKTQSCGCLQKERTSISNTVDYTNQETSLGIRFIKRHHKNKNGSWMWECECPICGSIFYDTPSGVKNINRSSCGCAIMSSGEILIKSYLENNGVPFQTQYTIDGCHYKYKLRFDFAILDKDGGVSHLIEYDGRQHYEPIEWFGGEKTYQESVERDKIKDEYCAEHNIPLTRLPYTMSNDDIKSVLKNIINP